MDTKNFPSSDGTTGSFYRPLDPAADERAEHTGEDTRCANCHAGFMFHVNGKCPKNGGRS